MPVDTAPPPSASPSGFPPPMQEPSASELLPFRNKARWQRLGRRGFFAPAMVISAVVALLFYYTNKVDVGVRVEIVCDVPAGPQRVTVGNALGINPFLDCQAAQGLMEEKTNASKRFNQVFGLSLLAMAVYFIYVRGGRRVPLTTLAGVFLVVAGATWFWSDAVAAPLFFMIQKPMEYVFGGIGDSGGLFGEWLNVFLVNALPEEVYKVIPLFVALWATTNAKEPWRTRLRITEPLDGICIAAAAAAGFIYAETYSLYIQRQITDLLQLQLAIPRVLGGIAGHIAYSAIAGYYIVLGATRSKNRVPIMLLGLFLAAAVHATWNTFSGLGGETIGTIVSAMIKIGAFGVMLVVIQAAREYSPSRVALAGAAPGSSTFAMDASVLGGASLFGSQTTASPPFIAPTPKKPSASTTPAPASAADAKSRVTPTGFSAHVGRVRLTYGTANIELASGDTLVAAQLPGLVAADGDQIVAQLLTHPEDKTRVGLRNRSTEPWTATTTSDGKSVTVAPGAVVTLKDGMSIHTAAGDIVVALP